VEHRAESSAERLLGELLDRAHTVEPAHLLSLVAEIVEPVGLTDLALSLQDYDQQHLMTVTAPSPPDDPEESEESITGTLAGRAFASGQQVDATLDDGRVRTWNPLLDGTDRVGVLAVTWQGEAGPHRFLRQLAGLVAELVVTKGRYTDGFFRLRRRRTMSLAAEMQWHLLPPLTVVTPRVALAGALEPAYEVGGDAFDYAVNGDVAHLGIFDAMGHGTRAAVMSAVTVGAYRHSRRQGITLADKYRLIDAALSSQFGEDHFATAQMANLNLRSGLLRWVNAGHPPPMLVRGRQLVRALEGPTTLPIGFGGGVPEVTEVALEPGDRVLFYTDGVVEERGPEGELFGEERLVDHLLRESAGDLSVSETVRRLSLALLAARRGHTSDDASLLLVEWTGGSTSPAGVVSGTPGTASQ
jgi:hypothetical protein